MHWLQEPIFWGLAFFPTLSSAGLERSTPEREVSVNGDGEMKPSRLGAGCGPRGAFTVHRPEHPAHADATEANDVDRLLS